MKHPHREKELDLVARYLAGTAEEADVRALESLLLGDADLRREFLSYANIDAAIEASLRPIHASGAAPSVRKKASPRPWRSVLLVAAAAVIIAGFAFAFWAAQAGVEVMVLASSGNQAERYPVGKAMKLRTVGLTDGSLQLRLISGVVLDLIAPLEVELVDGKRARLNRGSLTADVESSGVGFTIATASANIVDLGTRFGVSATPAGETDVAVFTGSVDIFDPADVGEKTKLATLLAGDAVTINSQARVRRQAAIATHGDSFFVLAAPPQDALITGIKDNIDEQGFRSFYSIQRGQMKPGVRAYSTLGRPRWDAMPGQDFPTELLGADVIGTFSSDRHERDLQLDIGVSKPCAVYLMLDARSPVPDWVQREFTATGIQLRAGPWAIIRSFGE